MRGHLVTVAAALRRALGFGSSELAALGMHPEVLALFPRWRRGSRDGFQPPAGRGTLIPAAATVPLGAIRLQMSPDSGAVPLVLSLLPDLEARLDPATAIHVMIAPGKAATDLRRLARTVLRPHSRVRFALGGSATAYARDHAVACRGPRGEPFLMVPRGFRPERGKEDAPLDARRVGRALRLPVRRSLLYWEGGNLLFDGHRCLVGADLVRENIGRLGLAQGEVLAILEAEFGVSVGVLGDLARSSFDGTQDRVSRSGQASYHIDLDVCPLGRVGDGPPTVMLADPHLGLTVLPAVLRHPLLGRWHGLPERLGARLEREEYERVAAERQPRLERYRRQLERLGYRVIGLPELRVDSERRTVGLGNMDFTYCNALPASRRGRPAVFYLPWGIRALDALAARQWRAAGVQPVALSAFAPLAHGMMELAAGLHCFVGPLPTRRRSR